MKIFPLTHLRSLVPLFILITIPAQGLPTIETEYSVYLQAQSAIFMRGIANLALQSLLFASAALEALGVTRGGEGLSAKIIQTRDEKTIWESSGDGNTHIRISDKRIKFGDTKNNVVLNESRRACINIGVRRRW